MRAQALFLIAADEMLHLARWKFLVIDIHRLHQPLDCRKLIAAVQNLKSLRQIRLAVMCAQHAVTKPVKRADPHTAHINRQHRGQARDHLLGGLIGKRHRQNPVRADLSGTDEIGDARSQHPRLAATRARKNQRGLGGQCDGCALFGIEAGKKG